MARPDRSGAHAATPRWRRLRHALAASTAVAGMVLVIVVPGAPSADAVDDWGFPTWSEVEAARGNEAAKNQQIEQIRGLIAQLETDLQTAQALSDQRAAEAIEAQARYDEAVAVAQRLQEQADEATERATESERAAGQLAAQLARSGGTGDMSAELFANPGSADNWLYRLDMMDRVAGTADSLYELAQQDANTAQALQDQAAVAQEALLGLKQEADAAYQVALEAAAAAQAAVEREQNHRVELEAQLDGARREPRRDRGRLRGRAALAGLPRRAGAAPHRARAPRGGGGATALARRAAAARQRRGRRCGSGRSGQPGERRWWRQQQRWRRLRAGRTASVERLADAALRPVHVRVRLAQRSGRAARPQAARRRRHRCRLRHPALRTRGRHGGAARSRHVRREHPLHQPRRRCAERVRAHDRRRRTSTRASASAAGRSSATRARPAT